MSELNPGRATGIEERVRAVTEEVLQGSPLFLVDLQIRGNKGSRVVEIFVDSDEGIDVEELARVSREVGFVLDTDEVIAGRYSLNVSSPGVDRPLTLPRQFRKNVGRRMRVRYRSSDGGVQEGEGDLEAVTEDGIALRISPSKQVALAYGEVIEARVLLPW